MTASPDPPEFAEGARRRFVPAHAHSSAAPLTQTFPESHGAFPVDVPLQFHPLRLAGLQAHRRVIAGFLAVLKLMEPTKAAASRPRAGRNPRPARGTNLRTLTPRRYEDPVPVPVPVPGSGSVPAPAPCATADDAQPLASSKMAYQRSRPPGDRNQKPLPFLQEPLNLPHSHHQPFQTPSTLTQFPSEFTQCPHVFHRGEGVTAVKWAIRSRGMH